MSLLPDEKYILLQGVAQYFFENFRKSKSLAVIPKFS